MIQCGFLWLYSPLHIILYGFLWLYRPLQMILCGFLWLYRHLQMIHCLHDFAHKQDSQLNSSVLITVVCGVLLLGKVYCIWFSSPTTLRLYRHLQIILYGLLWSYIPLQMIRYGNLCTFSLIVQISTDDAISFSLIIQIATWDGETPEGLTPVISHIIPSLMRLIIRIT